MQPPVFAFVPGNSCCWQGVTGEVEGSQSSTAGGQWVTGGNCESPEGPECLWAAPLELGRVPPKTLGGGEVSGEGIELSGWPGLSFPLGVKPRCSPPRGLGSVSSCRARAQHSQRGLEPGRAGKGLKENATHPLPAPRDVTVN
jgi:hypothetical protein